MGRGGSCPLHYYNAMQTKTDMRFTPYLPQLQEIFPAGKTKLVWETSLWYLISLSSGNFYTCLLFRIL